MQSASIIAEQLFRYVSGEEIGHNGRKLEMTTVWLKAYEPVLKRTVPELAVVGVGQLVDQAIAEPPSRDEVLAKLVEFLNMRPDARDRLLAMLGPPALTVIEGAPSHATSQPLDHSGEDGDQHPCGNNPP
jgi:hypothetical protein